MVLVLKGKGFPFVSDHFRGALSAEALAEKEKWKSLKRLLKARFILLNPGGSMDEWIEDQMESLK